MARVITDEQNYYDIADAIRGKLNVETLYLPSEMAAAIETIETGTELTSEDEGKVVVEDAGSYVLTAQTSLNVSQNGTYDTTTNDEVVVSVSGGGKIYNDYKDPDYVISDADALICTLSGRQYRKTNAGEAFVAYYFDATYTSQIMVSKTSTAVTFTTEGMQFQYAGTVNYGGETWYYSSHNYAMAGNVSSTDGFALKLSETYESQEAAATALLNLAYIPYPEFTANGSYEVPEGYDGWGDLVVAVEPTLQSKATATNGTVTPDEGYDGLSRVIVNVSGGGGDGGFVDIESLADPVVFSHTIGVAIVSQSRSEKSVTLELREYSSGYEGFNIPLSGLSIGGIYVVKFTYQLTSGAYFANNQYQVGHLVSVGQLTDYQSTLWGNTIPRDMEPHSITTAFSARATTMYFSMALSGMSDSADNYFTLSDFTVSEYQEGGSGGDMPALPSDYQELEYIDFTPSSGIEVKIPANNKITVNNTDYQNESLSFEVEVMASPDVVVNSVMAPFGYRYGATASIDYEVWFKNGVANIYERLFGNYTDASVNYSAGSVVVVRGPILNAPYSDAFIGRYSTYSAAAAQAFDGKIYYVKGFDFNSGSLIFWFMPCRNKQNNKIGFYDLIAGVFYSTVVNDSTGSIVAGPDA